MNETREDYLGTKTHEFHVGRRFWGKLRNISWHLTALKSNGTINCWQSSLQWNILSASAVTCETGTHLFLQAFLSMCDKTNKLIKQPLFFYLFAVLLSAAAELPSSELRASQELKPSSSNETSTETKTEALQSSAAAENASVESSTDTMPPLLFPVDENLARVNLTALKILQSSTRMSTNASEVIVCPPNVMSMR